MFDPGPCVYMEKLAGGPDIADLLTLDEPLTTVIERVAERKGTETSGVTVMMLDRPRHDEQMEKIREVGGRIRLISDGDVSAALFAVSESTGVDLLWGIGGTPEGVISAAAIKCLGGEMLGRLWPRDDAERQEAIDAGYDLDEILNADRLVSGDDVFFAATGVTDGELLQGVRYPRSGQASTESLVTRSRSGTVRTVQARHDQAKLREITGGVRYRCVDRPRLTRAFGYVGRRGTREPQAGTPPCRGRRHRLHRPQADARAARARRDGPRGRALAREGGGSRATPAPRSSKADVLEDEGLAEALAGVSIAYYLVHSMGRGAMDDSFAERDKQGAENFGKAAKAAGVDLIVYLGGLSDGGSKHLASRHESAEILQASGVPVTYVRAAAVVGARLGVVPHPLLPRQEAARRWSRPSGRERRRSPSRSRTPSATSPTSPASRRPTAARSRSAAPTSRPTAG